MTHQLRESKHVVESDFEHYFILNLRIQTKPFFSLSFLHNHFFFKKLEI